MRPVINLKELNTYVAPHHFKMEGLHTLKDLLKTGDWMTKVDLKDAYFMIPIHSSDRSALCFQVQSRHYQYTCLPFGLSCAPWVFTKTLKPVLTLLRELGVRLVAYIDDVLVLAETAERARDHTNGLIYLLENLGFLVHPEKTVREPTQEIEFLGMIVGSKTRELRLNGQKLKKIRLEAAKIRDQLATPSAREVSRLLGKFNSVSQAVPPGPLFSRALQRDLAAALESGDQCYETPCHLSHAAREELAWWVSQLSLWNGKESGTETARPSNRIRRITHRLGSSMPGDADRGTVVPAGEVPPHQLPRAPGSNASGENVPERSGRQESSAAARQPDSSDLHKQSGRDSLRPGHNNGERALDVVPTKGYPSDSTTSARSREREGRHRVESDEGSLRLDVEPKGFSSDPGSFPHLQVNLFATRLTYQLPRFYSWRPDPLAEATDAFFQDWRQVKGYTTLHGTSWGECYRRWKLRGRN